MGYTESGVCRIGNLTCMGCCGREYAAREEVTEAIRANTYEFHNCPDRESFRDREHGKYLRPSGVCRHVVFSDREQTAVLCPLHPALNAEDLRRGHCDIKYLCTAAKSYDEWGEEKRQAFVQFILNKNLDWFSFSMGMDDDSLLQEFEESYTQSFQ